MILPLLLAAALPAADSSIAPSLNAFTTASYQQLAGGARNLILSPFNIATALSMALAGARGRTAEEMQTVLHLHYDPAYDAAFGSLLAELNKAGNTAGNQLLTANALWLQKGFAIQPAFEKTLADNFQAPPTAVDFIARSEAARARINAWTEEHTKGKIRDLFAAGSLDAQTRLVLTSAIYFYGQWQDQFLTSRTAPAPFSLPAGGATQASFMHQTSHFGYTETPSAQILEMRYAATGMAFDVLLPKTVTGLPGVEKSLAPESLAGWLGQLSSRNVQVSLPKFRAESEFSLVQALSSMGMPLAFTTQADFSGIDPEHGLAISAVVHKAFVDVSERGTEAAAATGIGIHATAMRMPEPAVVFRADHPFLFLIRDTRTGVVLFIGRLTNPR
ncbi:MAG TPA: serpin family protein [Bryobacteraceae bacterium]|nr:serpin family protein [Bryobacteraceae bacterium]